MIRTVATKGSSFFGTFDLRWIVVTLFIVCVILSAGYA